jgi:hypothetical protein
MLPPCLQIFFQIPLVFPQQPDYFFIGGLAKIGVEFAYGLEEFRRMEAYNVVCHFLEFVYG